MVPRRAPLLKVARCEACGRPLFADEQKVCRPCEQAIMRSLAAAQERDLPGHGPAFTGSGETQGEKAKRLGVSELEALHE